MSLYKLLLYTEGSFFKAHQDTEKAPRHFATVVVVLPSLHTGGQLRVKHIKDEQVFDTSAASAYGTSFTVLYTDVFHSVDPVLSGNRLCMTFNLCYEAHPSLPLPRAPQSNSAVMQLGDHLRDWCARAQANQVTPPYIMHVLDHSYSAMALSFDAVKGSDRAKLAFIRQVASEHGMHVYLAQLECYRTGQGDEDCGYSSYKRGRYDYDDEDEEDGNCDTIIEEEERTVEISNLMDEDGEEIDVDFGDVDLEYATPAWNLEDVEPDEKSGGGHAGNVSNLVCFLAVD